MATSWNEEARISCEFRFKCPRTWEGLQPTADEGVRHCGACERDVHLAMTEQDFRRHREQGRCIAVRVLVSGEKADSGNEPGWWVGEPGPPYNNLRAILDEDED